MRNRDIDVFSTADDEILALITPYQRSRSTALVPDVMSLCPTSQQAAVELTNELRRAAPIAHYARVLQPFAPTTIAWSVATCWLYVQ
jgi:hypothetical protein